MSDPSRDHVSDPDLAADFPDLAHLVLRMRERAQRQAALLDCLTGALDGLLDDLGRLRS